MCQFHYAVQSNTQIHIMKWQLWAHELLSSINATNQLLKEGDAWWSLTPDNGKLICLMNWFYMNLNHRTAEPKFFTVTGNKFDLEFSLLGGFTVLLKVFLFTKSSMASESIVTSIVDDVAQEPFSSQSWCEKLFRLR